MEKEPTLKERALMIADVIQTMEEEGFDITLENRCCGCSRMTLEISAKEDMHGSDSVVAMRGV